MNEALEALKVGMVLGGVLGGMAALTFVAALGSFLIGTVSLYLGGRITGARGASLGSAALATFLAMFITLTLGTACSVVPVVGTFLGWAVSVAATVAVVEHLFQTDTGTAIGCVLIKWFLGLVFLVGACVTLGGGTAVLAILLGA